MHGVRYCSGSASIVSASLAPILQNNLLNSLDIFSVFTDLSAILVSASNIASYLPVNLI